MSDELSILFRLQRATFEWVDKPEFDRLCNEESWITGPLMDGLGDGHGEPYRPVRAIFGVLASGKRVQTNTASDKTRGRPEEGADD